VPTATQTPSPTPTRIPAPTPIGGGSGKVIFTLDKATFEKIFPDLTGDVNFFTSNEDGTDLTPITNGLNGPSYNYTIQGISPDGHKALIYCYTSCSATNGSLYIIALDSGINEPFKLAEGNSAKWIDNAHIVYAGKGKEGAGIYVVNIDGTNPKKISKASGFIVAVDSTRAYFENNVNKSFKDETGFLYMSGDFSALSWTNLDGSGDGPLESNGQQITTTYEREEYAFSPDGKSIAWIPAEEGAGCHYPEFFAEHGIYTKTYNDPSDPERVIDMAYIKDYARRCFIMYVAPLSEMDNSNKVVLMPPDEFFYSEFVFGTDYDLEWWPDASKIALLYRGVSMSSIYAWKGYPGASPVLFYAKPTDEDPKLSTLYTFPVSFAEKIRILNFTPDGQQIRLFDNIDTLRARFFDLQKLNFVNDSGNNENINFENNSSLYWLP